MNIKTAKEAEQYATSDYWVDPIHIANQKEADKFDSEFRASDHSESGKVHYTRLVVSEAAATLGRMTSDRKAAASRANGRRGGRPRKIKEQS